MKDKLDQAKAKLSRRELIKLGLLSGGAAMLTLNSKSTLAQWSGGGSFGGGSTSSPATTPFVDALPIPPVAQPVTMPTDVNTAAFQRYNEFPAQKFYELSQEERLYSFHRDLPPSPVWGFKGIYPGPTFNARYGEPMVVRFRNNLPANHVGFGIPSVITHLHNAHTASESDGFPADFYEVGTFKDHHYPNVLAGYDAYPLKGDVREALSTLWYHDHRMEFTAPNVYKGLAGFYLLFDERDSGNENDPNPNAFHLPSGEFDVPMIFADKRFDASGQLFFDQFDLDGFIGDKFTVNGKIQPYFKVARRKYRLRLLNAGPSRFYEFFLSNGQPFVQISNDGNLLPKPLTRTSIRLGVAERADVIVDFSQIPLGTQVFLQNRLKQTSGRGPATRDAIQSPGTSVLRFDVERDAADPSQVPATLRALPPYNVNEAVATRTFNFQNQNGAWTINNKFFDANVARFTVKKGTAEVWTLKNSFGDWSHPIHIHFEEFQIISRNGVAPPADEMSRKDVVRLSPNEEVKIFIRFRDFTGRYVMHCHNAIHEDHAMMLRFDIVP